MLPNHHITKPVLIGEIQDDGQFQVCSSGSAWLGAGARGHRARHHLRRHGRDQHGPRRADHDRRLHHLPGAAAMPNAIDYSLFVAIPAAFIVAGLFGIAIERGVIRFLYGRPLETLLATFGISLILQQLVRTTISAHRTWPVRTRAG
jgi:hypothetical protein